MTIKTCFCFTLAIFGVLAGPTSNPLVADLDKIMDTIPWPKILSIVDDQMAADPQFEKAIDFLGSKDFEASLRNAIETSEFLAILAYLGPETIDAMETAFGISLSDKQIQKQSAHGRTFKTFLSALADVLPKAKIQNVVKSLLSSSSVFKSFYTKVAAPAFNTLVQHFLNAPSVAETVKTLEAKGIDTKGFLSLMKSVFIL